MKIHQIAPPYIAVDPAITYGGIERVMYQLDRALQRKGHQTSMSAPKGSRPVGQLYETVSPVGIGTERIQGDSGFYLKLDNLAMAIDDANAGDFDVVHTHDENLLPFLHLIKKPTVYTIHSIPSELWNPEQHPEILELQNGQNLVAVSGRIMDIFNNLGFHVRHVVHNGFDIDPEHFSQEKMDYIFMIGVALPKKGQHVAVEISKRLGKPLILAGNIDDANYFASFSGSITHDLQHEDDKLAAYKNLPSGYKVVYVGRVNDQQKYPLFAHAQSVLVPSLVEDPLPGVVIESLACGTPVIAFNKGGIPEMVDSGKTGFIAGSLNEMTEMVRQADRIDPRACFERYARDFTSDAMADRYLRVYREVS